MGESFVSPWEKVVPGKDTVDHRLHSETDTCQRGGVGKGQMGKGKEEIQVSSYRINKL